MAYERIDADKTLHLTNEQRNEVRNTLKKDEDVLSDAARRLYRSVYVPARDGFKEVPLGIPTFGDDKSIDQDVYDKLRIEEEILDNMSPIVLKERYLGNMDHLEIHKIYDSMVRTPGESRVTSPSVIDIALRSGIKQGKFGLGTKDTDGKITCRFFKQDVTTSIDGMELLISDRLCKVTPQTESMAIQGEAMDETKAATGIAQPLITEDIQHNILREINLKFKIPRGKVSQLYGIMNLLQTKFQSLEIQIKANEGSISEDDFINKIKEGLLQLGIDLEDQ
jgi:hypothetical protein